MSRRARPPGFWRSLLDWAAGDRDGAVVTGDLDEEFAHHTLPRLGERRARAWYRRQVLRSVGPLLLRRMARARNRRTNRGRGDGRMGDFVQDLRYALRSVRKSPGFTAVVVLTLALGIGANTVIYSVVDGLVLNPFPFPDGDRLVAVGTRYPRLGQQELQFVEHLAPLEYVDIRDGSAALERVVAWDMGNRQVSFDEVTENVFTGFWWGDAFESLGVQPHLGRGMTWEETLEGAPVAVLSHRLWRRAFAADPSLVGRDIILNGNPYTVVGIMPPGTILYGMDMWIPMGAAPSVFPRTRKQWQVLGRIAEGYDLRQVNAELETLARQTEQAYGAEFEEYEGWRLEADTWTGANVRTLKPAAFILMGAVGFVLLLVCANIASLLLARSTTRRREMAVRAALGAGRGRLVRQVLTESLALALLGGAVGVAVAWIGVDVLGELVATVPFVSGGVDMNLRVLAFSAGVTTAAGAFFGLVPAMHGTRGAVQGTLAAETAAATGPGSRLRLQRVFVGVEVALALVLLAGGGLLLNSVIRMNRVDPGFAPQNVLTMRLTLPWEEYDGPAIGAFFRELEERVEGLPGVERVGAGSQFPTVAFSYRQVATEGQDRTREGRLPTALATLVSPGYFEALGIPLLRGRALGDRDVEGAPLVAVLNEAAANLLFPGQDPLGRNVYVGDAPFRVVGVAGNTRNRGIDEAPFPEVFAGHRQLPGTSNQLFLLVRTSVEPRSLLPAIRSQVRQLDPDQPVYAIRTAEEALIQATGARRIAANVLGLFAAFALLLAAVGIFAVVSYSVNDRTREIGLRVALGADGGSVRWLMVRQALVPVLAGSLIGLMAAVATGRALEGFLFQVDGADPLTLGGVVVLLVSVAVVASLVPARRATRLDPVQALREE